MKNSDDVDGPEEVAETKKASKSTKKEKVEANGESEPVPKKRGRAKKSVEEPVEEEENGEVEPPVKKPTKEKVAKAPKEKKAKAEPKPKLNKAATNFSNIDFGIPGGEKEFNYKISSINVAGLRAFIEKGGFEFVEHEKPDILCLQETKCVEDQLPDAAKNLKGYHPYWLCKPGGHAGVALYSKVMPIHVEYGIGDPEQDSEGRILTAEYEKFYLVCTYVPNAGRKLVTLDKRLRWNKLFEAHVKRLDAKKPVIITGDMNVAHAEIDLANPKSNKRNAGFTQEERDGMTDLLNLGFVDTFRHFYPDKEKAYTFWTYMANARAKNVGWRLDYFLTSERFLGKVVDNVMRSEVMGSDHCPITLFLKL
ncbi:recombination repair protein 1-like [Culicoides brevitarsis]|uniref:recombination repair protein 1-like n=1 Tax=Culicoides brevitarsis TaxID=469753 RepID=UPI00307C8C81